MINDDFYEHKTEPSIKCGECWQADILQTSLGNYKGDEAVWANDLTRLDDADTEPYQCDDCLKQSKGYDAEE